MKQYKLVNNLTGWLVFIIAAVVYCLTIEPTASFWDCPEFITSAYKLEVGHPPGAPFFMLTGNFFSLFADSPATVARMVNYMSALMSAACILFLFWTITHLVRKLIVKDGEFTSAKVVAIIGSGLVGALAYTFSDTFWFSAVEGEVYAYSSMFTALVFWLILKWEDNCDKPHSDRWLILIAYMVGLSIGVHLLNLLCIPAIVLVYYYKKNPEANAKGTILALIFSMVIVALVLYGIVPGVVKVGGAFELFAVNTLGLPFNTGLIVYLVLLVAVLIWAAYETHKSVTDGIKGGSVRAKVSFLATVMLLGIPFYGHGVGSAVIGILILGVLAIYLFTGIAGRFRASARTLNTTLLCMMLIMVGYSSYTLIVIRSSANTPMDQNSPEDIFTLGEYLGREQYGSRPLFYGQAYTSHIKWIPEGDHCSPAADYTTSYYRREKATPEEKDSYASAEMPEYKYAQNMLFPRMYSDRHARQYEEWMGGVEGRQVPYDDCGHTGMLKMPTQWENLKFFLSYQVNFMYWRYFMWNFVGRQNDIQSYGELEHGNWITGIPFIDDLLVGNQDNLPSDLANNKGHNVFYGLPLILGVIGLLWQAGRGRRGLQSFWIVFFLFFMTGLAIVLYLNQTPLQPRERDYAYAGSFYAFAIWIGMGVAAIAHYLSRWTKGNKLVVASAVTIVCLCVPIQMASQTWDDHDRSGRYVCRDFGQNYLMSVQEEGNPILFANGDNDTFPLWYNQETEGCRTDVRVCNLSYLQTDWYVDQMKRPAYDSPSLPISWSRYEYERLYRGEPIPVIPEWKEAIRAAYNGPDSLAWRKQYGDDPFELKNILTLWARNPNADLRCIPTDTVYITVDKEAVRRSGMAIPDKYDGQIPDKMAISLKGKRNLYLADVMQLELLANTNWERPMYIAMTVGGDAYLPALEEYFVLEGLAYRLTPFNVGDEGMSIDMERMYDNLMHKFKFGGIEKPGIYLDQTVLRICSNHRRIFIQLAQELYDHGDTARAKEVLDYCEQHIPSYNVPHEYRGASTLMSGLYYELGDTSHADSIVSAVATNSVEYLKWYLGMSRRKFNLSAQEVATHLYFLDDAVRQMEQYGSSLASGFRAQCDDLYRAVQVKSAD